MAIRTISDAGGNWNATTTWVEGAVPIQGDDVIATSTSGNLTLTAGAITKSLDFTNYVGTFNMNNFNLAIGTQTIMGTTFSLVPAMTFTFSSTQIPQIVFSGANGSLNTNIQVKTSGKILPNCHFNTYGTNNLGTNLIDDMNMNNFGCDWYGGYVRLNGANIYVRSNWTGYYETSIIGTSTFYMIGTGTFNPQGMRGVSNPFVIDTLGTINIDTNIIIGSLGTASGPANLPGNFTYVKGTITGSKKICMFGVPSTPHKINCSFTFSNVEFRATSNNQIQVEQTGPLRFDNMYLAAGYGRTDTTMGNIAFLGTGPLNGGLFNLEKIYITASTTGTHSFTINGTRTYQSKTSNALVCGTPSSVFVQFGTSSVDTFYTTFTNIISPNVVYTYQGTFSNSSNITVVNSLAPTGGGGGGGASSTTFLM